MPSKNMTGSAVRRGKGARGPSRKEEDPTEARRTKPDPAADEAPSLLLQMASLATRALQLAAKAGDASWQVGRAMLRSASPENEKMMQEAGAGLKDLRELAGLTRAELTEALHLSDSSLLEAVENGTATLSFELILRLAAVLARHDPVPFIIRFTRTYNPEIWGLLEKWGIGRIPVHLEREREFINIYRSRDEARKLSDEGFRRVLHFMNAAFEMALHFISEAELKSPKQARKSAGGQAAEAKGPAERQAGSGHRKV